MSGTKCRNLPNIDAVKKLIEDGNLDNEFEYLKNER